MTFEQWWAKEFSNVNIQWYENSSDALTKEWFNIVKQAFEDGKSAAQQQAEPATHSEDGRECQHQRTHYSQRNGGEHVCSNCGESANDAQPARQVGDVQLTGEYHADVNMLLERIPRHVVGDGVNWKAVASEQKGIIEGLQARIASLAPAAVALDGSASLINALEQVRTMGGNDEYADDVIGLINRSIYNHARLNRRALLGKEGE